MAPLPDNSTSRIFVDYNDQFHNHTWEVRYSNINSSAAAAMTHLAAFLTAIAPDLHEVTILSARNQTQGSLVTTPLVWSGAATYGSGFNSAARAPLQTMFLGRTPGGRRWRFSVFGIISGPDANFRLERATNTDIDNGYLQLALSHASSVFIGIDGASPASYSYASQNYNNHYEVLAHRS